jgi:methyl-accepting chemotaxis protein
MADVPLLGAGDGGETKYGRRAWHPADSVGAKIYLIVALFVALGILIVVLSLFLASTLNMVTNVARAERDFSVSLLEGRIAGYELMLTGDKAREAAMYSRIEYSRNYAEVFGRLKTDVAQQGVAAVAEKVAATFSEFDGPASKVLARRVALLGFLPQVSDLIDIASSAAKQVSDYAGFARTMAAERGAGKDAALLAEWTARGDAIRALPAKFSEGTRILSQFVLLVANLALLGVLAFAAAVGIVASSIIVRRITKPIARTVEVLRDLSRGEGDLTAHIDVSSRDELGRLAGNFNEFLGKLRESIAAAKERSLALSDAADSLGAAAAEMS